MFKIKYRIIDDIPIISKMSSQEFDEYKDVEGFFALFFNNHQEGYYHDNDLKVGEEGLDFIISWFDLLLNVCEKLTKTNIISFLQPECSNVWFEIVKKESNLVISTKEDLTESENIAIIRIEPINNFKFLDMKNIEITTSEFITEIKEKAQQFVDELIGYNPKLSKSKILKQLIENSMG